MTTGQALTISMVRGRYAICRIAQDDAVPPWALDGPFCSISRTADELSVICEQGQVPYGVRCERDWRCLRLGGPFPFTMVGVLSGVLAPLAAAGVSILALSTHDTDYVLVRDRDLVAACAALVAVGHHVAMK